MIKSTYSFTTTNGGCYNHAPLMEIGVTIKFLFHVKRIRRSLRARHWRLYVLIKGLTANGDFGHFLPHIQRFFWRKIKSVKSIASFAYKKGFSATFNSWFELGTPPLKTWQFSHDSRMSSSTFSNKNAWQTRRGFGR